MKESLATFRKAVNESADLQEKIKGGTDLVKLGKENGYDFSGEDVTAAYEELQGSDEGLTEFELEAVSGGESGFWGGIVHSRHSAGRGGRCC
jgi:predicted ribosomally synthesized peptide with nif11-like leader